MRHFIIASGLAALLAFDAHAQNTNVAFIAGKLAVFRGGDGVYTIATDRQHPSFIDEYDPAIPNQVSPIMTVALPTNGANAMWFNAHAGSEGQGLTRSADRQSLAVTGYYGDLNSIPGTPSSATNDSGQGYDRGFGIVDAFTNFNVVYHSQFWFGLLPGITQNNPRGIATDGANSNFWGCGTVAGTPTGGFDETGTLYWSPGDADPYIVQNYVDSAYSMKIINGVLYMVAQNETGGAQANGVYDFVDNNNNLFPLPDAGNNIFTYYTNLFLPFGATYSHVETFDMNPAGTIAYAADEVYGVVKFVNSGGTWTSPYYFNSNNIGSATQPKGATGCFGIAVDFSGTNPVIYATTLDEGDGANTCSNRLISIVDNGAPDPNALLAQTLATASNINEVFRGVDFTPDLAPLITAQPVDVDVITNTTVTFSVGVQSVYPVTYQWQDNGSNVVNGNGLAGVTNSTLTLSNVVVSNSGSYTVIVSNSYGAVTSQVASLFVSLVPIAPTITNAVIYATNYIANNQSFSVSPNGTPPFSYQWSFGNNPVSNGSKYSGATNATLTISNLQLTDSGSYYITVTNQSPTNGITNQLAAVLTVQYLPPSIPSNGQPGNVTMLQGQTTTLSVTSATGTPPLSYQWYQGNISNPLGNVGEFSGTGTNALTITGATLSDAANYFCVVSNGGGSATSLSASVTVIVPPALSYVAYSNQVYFQNFDSLPNPGATSVNTSGGGGPVTIGSITYEVADPFDFAYPLYDNITAGASGGLNLAATMSGWYGECDGDTAASGAQLGASWGDQTTGGIISFGLTNAGSTGNRSLGLIATSTSGVTHFGLKLINATASNLNYMSLQYTGENWKLGTLSPPKIMSIGYSIDPTGNNSTLSTSEISAAAANTLSNLSFSFPRAARVGPTNGNLSVNQTNEAVTNLALASAWTPGSALWLVWSLNNATGSGQGYGIDNFSFYASSTTNLTQAAAPTLGGVAYSANSGLSFGFTSAPGDSAKFSVRATTNLTVPLSQWVDLGHPTELSFGNYQFTDAHAQTNAQTFYTVTSP